MSFRITPLFGNIPLLPPLSPELERQIQEAVVVHIAPTGGDRTLAFHHSGVVGYFGKGAVAVVAQQVVFVLFFIGDVQVEVAVVVVVSPVGRAAGYLFAHPRSINFCKGDKCYLLHVLCGVTLPKKLYHGTHCFNGSKS